MNFDLKRPCANCPFRTDIRPFLHPERAREICDAMLLGDESFWCHKTIDCSEASEGSTNRKTQHCAGGLILLEKLNRPNQLMRIAERIRCYDRTQLDMAAPVFEAPEAFIDACRRQDAAASRQRIARLRSRGVSVFEREDEQ